MYAIWCTPYDVNPRSLLQTAVKTFSLSLSILKTEEPRKARKKNPWLRSWLGTPTHKENKKKLKTKIKKLNEINKRHCHILINSSQGRSLAANLKHTGSTALKARLV